MALCWHVCQCMSIGNRDALLFLIQKRHLLVSKSTPAASVSHTGLTSSLADGHFGSFGDSQLRAHVLKLLDG